MGRVPGIVKWVFAPMLAAALGYWAIGPRLAGKVPIPKAIREGVGTLVPDARIKGDPTPEPGSSQPTPPKVAPPPEVTADAQPVAESKPAAEEERPKPRRRRRRRAAPPSAEAPPEVAPEPARTEPDPASVPEA